MSTDETYQGVNGKLFDTNEAIDIFSLSATLYHLKKKNLNFILEKISSSIFPPLRSLNI